MTLQASQTVPAGVLSATVPLTPAASDTCAASSFGPNGLIMRVLTSGTLTNLQILDPTLTPAGNAGAPPTLVTPATGGRLVFVPRSVINPATQLATWTWSSVTGVTYELYQV